VSEDLTEVGGRCRWHAGVERIVLNAFRHHRGGRNSDWAMFLRSISCSTPFGITEVGGRRNRPSDARERVLNAFRHHRGGRTRVRARFTNEARRAQRLSASQRWAGLINGWKMSLLWGAQRLSASQRWAAVINGQGVGIPLGAQRLSASQRWAGRWLASADACPIWCSTPFGITEVGGGARPASPRPRSRAQRLSASQRWAGPTAL